MTVWSGVMEEYDSLTEHVARFARGLECAFPGKESIPFFVEIAKRRAS